MNVNEWGPATVCIVLLTAIVAIAGAVVCTTTDNLSYKEYVDSLQVFAVALGILGVGRGLATGLKKFQSS